MKRNCFYLVFLLLLSAGILFAEERGEESPWNAYVELDQMFCLKIGAEYEIADSWGIKGSVGTSFTGLGHVSYDLAGIKRFRPADAKFQLNSEFGLLLAYFNFMEGAWVDMDPIIDDPYYGWCPGVNLVWGWRFDKGTLGLKTGAVVVTEYQRDSGWRDPIILPEIALEWVFSGPVFPKKTTDS